MSWPMVQWDLLIEISVVVPISAAKKLVRSRTDHSYIQVQFCRQVTYVWIIVIFKAYKLWFNNFESTFFNLCANKVLLHHWHYQLSCWAICGVDVTVFCPRTKAAPSWYALNWKVLYEWKTNNLISPNNHWKRSNDIFDQKGYDHRYLIDNIPLS